MCTDNIGRQNAHFVDLFTHNGGLQVDKHGTGYVLPSSSLAEERVGGVVAPANGLVGRHLPVRLDTVLQAVQLPAGIADLHAGLPNMDRDALTLQRKNGNATSEAL